MQPAHPGHRPGLVVVVAAASAGFWVLTLVAGQLVAGYDTATDTLSALAARDTQVRQVGVAAGLLLALAHLATGALLAGVGARAAALAAGLSSVAGVALFALAPITCPGGAAGCSDPLSGRGAPDGLAVLHRDLAVAYELCFVLAALLVALAFARRGRRAPAVVAAAGAVGSVLLALQLRRGVDLGLWERGWVGVNTLLLLLVSLAVARRVPLRLPHVGRGLLLLGLGGVLVLLPLSVTAQPAYDLRRDLVSALASHGARLPVLGQVLILTVALAHLGAATVLASQPGRAARAAAASGAVAAAGLVAIAFVRITCPRGARGCSGPESGRAVPRPLADTVHRDLVVVVELGSVALLALLAMQTWRAGDRALAVAVTVSAALSPALLLRQQAGQDIGLYQLGWLAAGLLPLLAVLALHDRPVTPRPPGPGSAAHAPRTPAAP